MSQGQRAMVVAKLCKETLQSTREIAATAKFSHQRIHQARTVLQFAPDLVDGVMDGTVALDTPEGERAILSANIHRRHMSQGQRAMVVAKVLETNSQTVSDAAKGAGLNRTRIAQARTVLRYGPDLVAYILSANIHRRHMSQGQRAMVMAKLHPQRKQGKRANFTGSGEVSQVSQQRISEARLVLECAPARLTGGDGPSLAALSGRSAMNSVHVGLPGSCSASGSSSISTFAAPR